VIHK